MRLFTDSVAPLAIRFPIDLHRSPECAKVASERLLDPPAYGLREVELGLIKAIQLHKPPAGVATGAAPACPRTNSGEEKSRRCLKKLTR